MNTKPDETLLARWVEDELTGAELAQAEAWTAGQPEWLARREESRAWRAMLRRGLPAAEEPPYLEFFQARIAHAVRLAAVTAAASAEPATADPRTRSGWSPWRLPLAAAAGMALCFWAGTRFAAPANGLPPPIAAGTSVYVPEQGVKANVYESAESAGVVIELDGVQAIPDSFEIPEQAGPPRGSLRSATTAALEQNPDTEGRWQ